MEEPAGSVVVCGFCGSGCCMRMVAGGGGPIGISPIRAHPTSQGRLCRRGWTIHQSHRDPARLKQASIRRDGRAAAIAWDEAIDAAAERLKGVPRGALAVVASPTSSNESLYLLGKLARAHLRTPHIDFPGRAATVPTQRLMEGWVEAVCTLGDLDTADRILAIGLEDGDRCPQVVPAIWRAVSRGARLIAVDAWRSDLLSEADILLTPRPHTDAAWLDALGSILAPRYLPRISARDAAETAGLDAAAIERAAEILHGGRRIAVVFSTSSMSRLAGSQSIDALGRVLSVLRSTSDWLGVLPLYERSNTLGAIDMGIAPDLLPGWRDSEDPASSSRIAQEWGVPVGGAGGMGIEEMLDASTPFDAILIVGDIPETGVPGWDHLLRRIERIPFRMAVASFPSAWSEIADLVLPRPLPGEAEGTYTNTEGRVQWSHPVQPPPGRQEWEIWAALGEKLGAPWKYASIRELRKEIAATVPGYEPLAEESVEGKGAFLRTLWEVGKLGQSLPAEPITMRADGDGRPLLLCVERAYLPYHFDAELLRSPIMRRELAILPAEPHAFIHPADAKEAVVRDQSRAVIRSSQGEAKARVLCRSDVPRGRVIVPEIYGGALAAPLAPGAGSPEKGIYPAIAVAVAPH